MIGKSESNGYLFNNLETMLEQSQPLFRLAKQIPWDSIEKSFKNFYIFIQKKGGQPQIYD